MNTIWIVLPVLLVLMFQLGIELDGAAFRRVAKHPKALFVGLAGQLLLLPAAAFAVGTLFRLPPVYFMGLMLIACCPGGSSSNVFSMLARGDVALSVTLTALSSIITLFTIPPVMAFAARIVERHTETSIDLPVAKLILQNIVLLFLPMAAGALFRRLRNEAAERVSAVLKRVAFPALMLLAALFFLQYTREIIANIASLGAATAAMLLLSTGPERCWPARSGSGRRPGGPSSSRSACKTPHRRLPSPPRRSSSTTAKWPFRPSYMHW